MAQNVNATFVKTPNLQATQITTGTGSSVVVGVYTGGVSGSKVNGFVGTGIGTTAAFDVQWGVANATTFFILGTVSIPAGAGSSDTLPAVNMFNTTNSPGLTLDSDGNPFVILPSSAWLIEAKSPATSSTWTTGAVINLVAVSGADF